MDPFNFPAIGDPRAVGSKFGSSSGTSTDIIYPVSKQIDDAFLPGRTLEFAWKSDQHRMYSPKNTRLYVEYEFMFGEVDETCSSIPEGPKDSSGAPPSKSLRMTAAPNSTLFDSQVRYVANNTVVEQTNFYSDVCQAQLLTTSNIEGTNTSASNMLTSLRKDAGVPSGVWRGMSRTSQQSDGVQLCPIVHAPYVIPDDDSNYEDVLSTDTFGEVLAKQSKKEISGTTIVAATSAASDAEDDTGMVKLKLSTTEATAKVEVRALLHAADGGMVIVKSGNGKFTGNSLTSRIVNVVINGPDDDGNYAGSDVDVEVMDTIATAIAADDTVDILADEDVISDKPETAKMTRIASTLACKVKSDVGKHTTPNPKAQVLHQGYHPGSKVSTVQISEPILLPSWNHPYAMPSGSYQLFTTISPNYLKDLLYDPSGQYGCPGRAGEAIMFGATRPSTIKRNTVYVRVKDVSLHVHYIHPVEPFIPKSISIKYNPITVAKRQLRNQNIQETFVVAPSCRALLLFLVQDINHLCADFELDGRAKAGAGVNALGITDDTSGQFKFDSRAQKAIRDVDIDPREHNSAVTD